MSAVVEASGLLAQPAVQSAIGIVVAAAIVAAATTVIQAARKVFGLSGRLDKTDEHMADIEKRLSAQDGVLAQQNVVLAHIESELPKNGRPTSVKVDQTLSSQEQIAKQQVQILTELAAIRASIPATGATAAVTFVPVPGEAT